jgi:hypothetical protein
MNKIFRKREKFLIWACCSLGAFAFIKGFIFTHARTLAEDIAAGYDRRSLDWAKAETAIADANRKRAVIANYESALSADQTPFETEIQKVAATAGVSIMEIRSNGKTTLMAKLSSTVLMITVGADIPALMMFFKECARDPRLKIESLRAESAPGENRVRVKMQIGRLEVIGERGRIPSVEQRAKS